MLNMLHKINTTKLKNISFKNYILTFHYVIFKINTLLIIKMKLFGFNLKNFNSDFIF